MRPYILTHTTLAEERNRIQKDLKGEMKICEVKTHMNQNVFRQMIIVNYSYKCAITGIDIPDLLFVSHITPWAANENERLNPENEICLSTLYDKAFDKELIGFDKNFQVVFLPIYRKTGVKITL
jgi:putative restriction endonuclease